MLHVHEVLVAGELATKDGAATPGLAPAPTLTLTFDQRRRSRRLARLDDGREVALRLPRGTILRHGDRLRAAEDGLIVEVRAAAESLSVGRTGDPHLLSRAAYHLGNRHVPLQIGAGWVAYAHDHVLDDLARGLGLTVETRQAPFEPEAGAFHQHEAGRHGHDHHDHHHDGDGEAHHHHHAPDGEPHRH
jgi:urease accessory protein